MIDISKLSVGDVVRNNGSGVAYDVITAPLLRSYFGGQYWSVRLSPGGIECSNPSEWDLIEAQRQRTLACVYSIEVDGVRYSAPDADGVVELMRAHSELQMGLR